MSKFFGTVKRNRDLKIPNMKFSLRALLALIATVAVVLTLFVPVNVRISIPQYQPKDLFSSGSEIYVKEVSARHDSKIKCKFVGIDSNGEIATVRLNRFQRMKIRGDTEYVLMLSNLVEGFGELAWPSNTDERKKLRESINEHLKNVYGEDDIQVRVNQ